MIKNLMMEINKNFENSYCNKFGLSYKNQLFFGNFFEYQYKQGDYILYSKKEINQNVSKSIITSFDSILKAIDCNELFKKGILEAFDSQEIEFLLNYISTDEEINLCVIHLNQENKHVFKIIDSLFQNRYFVCECDGNLYLLIIGHLNIDYSSFVSLMEEELFTSVNLTYIDSFANIRDINNKISDLKRIDMLHRNYLYDKPLINGRDALLAEIVEDLSFNDVIKLHKKLVKNDVLNLEPEDLKTIDEYLDNNMNLAKTSQELFIHRNTLQYRLSKYNHYLGLDLHKYDETIKYSIAKLIEFKIKKQTPYKK